MRQTAVEEVDDGVGVDVLPMIRIPSGLQRHCPGTARRGSSLPAACARTAIGAGLGVLGSGEAERLTGRSLATGAPPFNMRMQQGPRTISWLATPPIRAFVTYEERTERWFWASSLSYRYLFGLCLLFHVKPDRSTNILPLDR